MTSPDPFDDAIAALVRVGILDPKATPSTIVDLVLAHVRDITRLTEFAALETLSISGAQVSDYTPLSTPPVLHVLTLENSTITTLDGALARELRVANVRRNRLTNIDALRELSGLQVLDVSGNPLDPTAAAFAEELRGAGVVVTIDDDAVLEINRALATRDSGFVCFGAAESCFLTVTGLERSEAPESIAVPATAAQISDVVDDDTALWNLVENRWG